jgi:hypothetical protein
MTYYPNQYFGPQIERVEFYSWRAAARASNTFGTQDLSSERLLEEYTVVSL